jgi:DNA-binding transcriptional MocR family regulator
LHLVESGNLERHIRHTRPRYAKARATLSEALAPVDNFMTLRGIEAGLHVVLVPRQDVSVQRVVELAAERGLRPESLDSFPAGTPGASDCFWATVC